MKESKEQIRKHLERYKADEVKLLFSVVAESLLNNEELILAGDAEGEKEMFNLVAALCGKNVPFSFEHLLDTQELSIVDELDKISFEKKKIRKAQRLDLIAEVFCSDSLLEAFCLAFPEADDKLEGFMALCGCAGRYQSLAADPVYQKRRAYIRLLVRYAVSAVNLYGVIHVADFTELIVEPVKSFRNKRGYCRDSGSYQYSLIFSPEWICTATVKECLMISTRKVIVTPDGLMVHPCFADEVEEDIEALVKLMAECAPELPEQSPGDFFDENSKSYYRILYDIALNKEIYLPADTEFLRYEDPDYYEHSNAETEMKIFIKKNLRSEFQNLADYNEMDFDDYIDDVLHDFHDMASDAGLTEERDVNDYTEYVCKFLENAGISFNDTDMLNLFLRYAMEIANSTRLWSNHGHTPAEINRTMKKNIKGLTVVPGSSHAAEMLSESREELARMGVNVDLDSNAAEVPRIVFGSGIQGDMKVSSRKIYPNDPCPCGSGKKYKKCCGKGR